MNVDSPDIFSYNITTSITVLGQGKETESLLEKKRADEQTDVVKEIEEGRDQ